ncbi:hypothetical protein I41_16230 [Lacipirellula limnantheis]|uniref:Uncharacterized protein n=2 Tax=Lacipirellula limnantheis TaxID=2528024 RepID=A0A517TVP3_9BACT|nr:hypothetical protein I41_16230 [Lacipirellula limnantheis]
MNEDRLQSPGHSRFRTAMQVGGPVILVSGLLLTGIAFGSFLLAMGGQGPPRFFWCAFLGMPMVFVGGVLSMFGYIGTVQRYLVGESAPVAKDVVNYMGENTQPGLKAMGKAVAEGVMEAQKGSGRR